MVTADAMETSVRILEKTRADAHTGEEGTDACTGVAARHLYNPEVVERLLSLIIEPLSETTKCAKRFRSEVASVTGDAVEDRTPVAASELVKVFNSMTKVYVSAKEQLESSVFQFIRQHRRIFDESFRTKPSAAANADRNMPCAPTQHPTTTDCGAALR